MDVLPHPAAHVAARAHFRTAAAAAAVVVAAFASAAGTTGMALGASAPTTFNMLAALDRQSANDPAGAGPPGSRRRIFFCSGPVSITATCPCYWRVQADSTVSGLFLDAALVLARTQPPGTTEADLEAAAVTLAGSSVSGGALAPDRNSATEYLFESPSAIIRDPVTVVATATLAGWAGVGDNGDCATELLLPLRPVEATCPTLDISIGGRGGHNAVARGWAFTTKAQPAATAVLPKIPHSNCCKRGPWPSGQGALKV